MSNDKENNGNSDYTKLSKVTARRAAAQGRNENPLDSISINVSPPQSNYRSKLFAARKLSEGKPQLSSDIKKSHS